MPNMDYSLIHRTPDGTGKILVTTPASPDKGSWESEAELKNWILADALLPADIVNNLTTADPTKVLSAEQGTVLKQLIDAVSGGIVPKGDILSSNLPAADDTNKGWQYYCTDINKWATSDGTQWIMTSNNIITQTPDETDTGHALSNAVVTQCCNEVKGKLNQHESRLENLEQKAGDYTTVQYRGTNAVPTGKAKNGLVETFVGKSRAWNQMIPLLTASNFTTGSIYSSALSNDSDGNLVATSTSGIEISCACPFVSGRKYLVSVILKSSISGNMAFFADSTNLKTLSIPSANTYQTITEILSPNANTAKFRIVRSASASETLTVNEWLLRDLTLIFGAGNEPSTVAEALAQLPALGQYNAYDAGSLVSTEVSGVKSVGVNIWDETWEVGTISQSTGENSANNNTIRSEGFIPVTPSTNYSPYVNGMSMYHIGLFYYDYNKNFLSYANPNTTTKLFQTPSGYFYIRFACSTTYGSTYNHNIAIARSDTALTHYYPYKTDALSLPSPVTLRSAGSVADTDELNVEVLVDGVKVNKRRQTTRVGSVDLGSLTYVKESSYSGQFYADVTSLTPQPLLYGQLVCGRFLWQSGNVGYDQLNDGYMAMTNAQSFLLLRLRDSKYSAMTKDEFKEAMSGVYLNYQVVAPTTESIDPVIDNFIEVEGGGTIDTIQEQTPVIDNCLDVGYLTV